MNAMQLKTHKKHQNEDRHHVVTHLFVSPMKELLCVRACVCVFIEEGPQILE